MRTTSCRQRGDLRLCMVAALVATLTTSGWSQALKVDSTIPKYQRVSGVSGNLSSVGSDTLNNLMTLWAEGFKKNYPNIRIQIEGKGSSTAPPALIEGTAQLGPMSRAMKASEEEKFEKKFGYKPTQIRVAIDALAVYTNKDNPLEKLTLPQVDAIFSSTRKLGNSGDLKTWGEVGLSGTWAKAPFSVYGRNSASGTYGYFKKVALGGGDYKPSVKEQPGSASVVQGVSADLYGIGYSGIGYKTSGVKTLALARKDGDAYGSCAPESVLAGQYPLSRFLYVYVNKAPNKPLDPLVAEFVKYILSYEGQLVVVKDGYFPLTNKVTDEEKEKVGPKLASR